MSYLIRRVLAKPRLISDEMCCLYGKFASNLRRVLCKTRLIFPRINSPNMTFHVPVVVAARKCTKKFDARAELLYYLFDVLFAVDIVPWGCLIAWVLVNWLNYSCLCVDETCLNHSTGCLDRS